MTTPGYVMGPDGKPQLVQVDQNTGKMTPGNSTGLTTRYVPGQSQPNIIDLRTGQIVPNANSIKITAAAPQPGMFQFGPDGKLTNAAPPPMLGTGQNSVKTVAPPQPGPVIDVRPDGTLIRAAPSPSLGTGQNSVQTFAPQQPGMFQFGPDGKLTQAAPSPSIGTGNVSPANPIQTNPVQTSPVQSPIVAPNQDPLPQVTPPLDANQGQTANTQPTTFAPFDLSSIQRTGTYGESVAFRATDYIKNLRKALDAGQISTSDFLKLGQPAAEIAFKEIQSIGGKGSKAADLVNPLLSALQGAGFTKGADSVIRPTLPPQYQQKAPDQLLPSNIPSDEQKQLLTQLPPNVDPYSDQGKIEVENLREQAQQQANLKQQQDLKNQAITGLQGVIGQQSDIRQSGLSALQKSLEDEANRQFSLDQPGIYEDLNARGLLRSSALGDRLAQQKGIYAGQVASQLGQAQYSNTQQSADDLNKLAAARLASTDSDVQAIQQGLLSSNQLQQSGLSRQFGLQDFQSQANLARQIAQMSQPQTQNPGTFNNALNGATSGGMLGAVLGPVGAVTGGILGAVKGITGGGGK